MTACLLCPHAETDHDPAQLGSRCHIHYGALGDSSFLETGAIGEPCQCPGYEPDDEYEAV